MMDLFYNLFYESSDLIVLIADENFVNGLIDNFNIIWFVYIVWVTH